jgi:hypothetical protein
MPYEEGADDYPCSYWNEKRVRIRKAHRCCECSVEIPVGEMVGRAKSVYDGKWYASYRCAACLILAELAATIEGECALWGGLADFIDNLNWGREKSLPYPVKHRKLWEAPDEE